MTLIKRIWDGDDDDWKQIGIELVETDEMPARNTPCPSDVRGPKLHAVTYGGSRTSGKGAKQ